MMDNPADPPEIPPQEPEETPPATGEILPPQEEVTPFDIGDGDQVAGRFLLDFVAGQPTETGEDVFGSDGANQLINAFKVSHRGHAALYHADDGGLPGRGVGLRAWQVDPRAGAHDCGRRHRKAR